MAVWRLGGKAPEIRHSAPRWDRYTAAEFAVTAILQSGIFAEWQSQEQIGNFEWTPDPWL